jgi:hypothetical protein
VLLIVFVIAVGSREVEMQEGADDHDHEHGKVGIPNLVGGAQRERAER